MARMTFVMRPSPEGGLCIFELHSSQLPDSPDDRRRLRGSSFAAAPAETNHTAETNQTQQIALTASHVIQLTYTWMDTVVEMSYPAAVADLFCEDGILVATAGTGLRMQTASEDGWGLPKPEGTTIKSYFEWFAKLPEQAVLASYDNLAKVSETVWINNAWVNWEWSGNPGLTARMTFIVRAEYPGACIFELHSSQLPEN